MTLLQLQYFQILARMLHYTRTAEELHISQPSLSYAITELEKELGIPLFDRDKKRVTLTIYGQQFLEYVERALALLDEGRSVLEQISNETDKVVRLGYFQSISASLIPSLVEKFYSSHNQGHQNQESQIYNTNNIRFHFTEGSSLEILSKIQDGEIDMGFCLHQAKWARSMVVLRQPLFLAVHSTHRLARREHVSFADFASEPQIMLERGTCLRGQLDRLYEQHKMTPNIVFEVRGCSTALQYVGLNFGVAVLPQVPVMDSTRVAVLPISDHNRELVRSIYFTVHKTRPLSDAAQRVRDFIEKQFIIHGA